MFTICVSKDHPRLEQLELLLSLIVNVNFHYIFTKCSLCTHYMFTICVNKDHPRLEQLELLLSLIVSVNFRMVSILQLTEVQHQI